MLIAAFGNAYNDICDLPADRVNRPDRVLVRGEIDMTLALRIGGVLRWG
jgi:4-hydroxybenzoate polyprenyltransferase